MNVSKITRASAGRTRFCTLGLLLCLSSLTLSSCGLAPNENGGITINTGTVGGPAQGSGYRTQQQRTLGQFHAVDINAVCDVQITDGQPFNVIVEADENLFPQIITEIKDGALTINLDKSVTSSKPFRLLISMPKLDKLTCGGVGLVNVNNIAETSISIKQAGAGTVTAQGSADMVDLTLSGVGQADLKQLQAKAVTVLLSGTGSAKVYALEMLTAEVSGIGRLTYSGSPAKLQKKVTGMGSINPES